MDSDATQSHSNFLLGIYYRPPGTSVEALVHLNNSLMSLSTCNLPLVLCGDFNVPNIDWVTVTPVSSTRPAELLCSIVADNSLAQLVACLVCECNILDLVLANHECVSLGTESNALEKSKSKQCNEERCSSARTISCVVHNSKSTVERREQKSN